MKKVLFLTIMLMLFSCKKDSQVVITGDWDLTFIINSSGTNTNTGVMSIAQDGNNLTGTIDWGGKVRPLLPDSNINEDVSIYCENLLFHGSVNDDANFMSGDLYNFDYFEGMYSKDGTWQAKRK